MEKWVPIVLGVAGICLFIGCILYLVFLPLIRYRRREKQLLATGLPAQAVILEIKPTIYQVNGKYIINLTLQVQPSQQPPFKSFSRTGLANKEYGRLKPGDTLAVKYDPANTGMVAIIE